MIKNIGIIVFFVAFCFGCASNSPVKAQAYAQLQNQRVFEQEFSLVWKGIETALKNHKMIKKDPEEASALELQKLSERTLETDWVYSQSRDKYIEYKVNGFPRKKYLQLRYKHEVDAKRVMGGTEVTVTTQEEVERLNSDGFSAGFSKAETQDSSLSNGLLEKINLALLSQPAD